jgi:hypothetical protein
VTTSDTAAQSPAEDNRYVQASFRLTPDTLESIKQMALAKGVNQSSIMRESTTLLRHTVGLKPNQKLAVVDIDDQSGTSHFRVLQWLVE